jgi:hypothetical protein
MESLADVGRSAHDGLADLVSDRHGLAGQRRLIENGDPFHDRSVDRNHVALSHHYTIPRLDRVEVDLLEPAVTISDGAARHAGEQRGHLAAGAAFGETLEILPAGIHHRDHRGGEVFAEDQGREHRQRRNEVQAHIAVTQADDDLDQEGDENRSRGRGPYRPSPMLPSGEVQSEAEKEPARGPCGDNGRRDFRRSDTDR